MEIRNPWGWAAVAVLVGRLMVEFGLEALNRQHLRRVVSQSESPGRERALAYAEARSRFREVELLWETGLLAGLWLTGLLAWWWEGWREALGTRLWADAGFVWVVLAGVYVASWPLRWYERFHLEERFGFNTTRPRTWWADRAKGLLLGTLLGLPAVAGLLALMQWDPAGYWMWGWALVVGGQWVISWLAPVILLPWFHRFTPLPEGPLRERLLALARRTGFRLADVQVMDGSRRTRHSNAFFTGWGRFRRVILYDTLLAQLTPEELEAVVAHELGHDRLRHWQKMMLGSALGWFVAFAAAACVAQVPSLFRAFGFSGPEPAILWLGLGMWAGPVSAWMAPWIHACLRRWEFAADAFAARVLGTAEPLARALERLHRENLMNLPSHPWYRWVRESHPSLEERLAALTGAGSGPAPAVNASGA